MEERHVLFELRMHHDHSVSGLRLNSEIMWIELLIEKTYRYDPDPNSNKYICITMTRPVCKDG